MRGPTIVPDEQTLVRWPESINKTKRDAKCVRNVWARARKMAQVNDYLQTRCRSTLYQLYTRVQLQLWNYCVLFVEIASKNKSKTRRFDCQFPARATLAFDFFSIYDRLAHLDREEISSVSLMLRQGLSGFTDFWFSAPLVIYFFAIRQSGRRRKNLSQNRVRRARYLCCMLSISFRLCVLINLWEIYRTQIIRKRI